MSMLEFLAYVENTTDAFAMKSTSSLIKDIHKRVLEVKESKEMEVGRKVTTSVIRRYVKGNSADEIAAALKVSIESVYKIIDNYENE